MIVEYIRYTVADEHSNDFIEAYEKASIPLVASPHCLSYELSRCEEEPTSYIIRIQWTSTSDHLELFRKSEEFKEFLPYIKPYIGMIKEMQHYNVLSSTQKTT